MNRSEIYDAAADQVADQGSATAALDSWRTYTVPTLRARIAQLQDQIHAAECALTDALNVELRLKTLAERERDAADES